MVVMEKKIGNALIRICDDYVVSEKEKEEILKRIASMKEKAPAGKQTQ